MAASADLKILIGAKDNASGVLGKVGSSIGNIAKGAAVAAAAAAVALGGLVATTVGMASDLNETMSKSGVVFGDWADEIAKFGDSAATSLGMSKQQAVEAAATLGNLFKGMGMGGEATADMSTSIVKLAADLASFNNIPIDEALEKLRSGLVGEAEPLRSLGVLLTEDAVKAKAMAMGLADSSGNISEAAKVQARYAMILEQTGTAQGDFARTSDGLANSQRILSAQLDNVRATVGTAFLPVVTMASNALGKFLDYMKDTGALDGFAGAIGGALTDAMTTLSNVAGTVIGVFKGEWADNEKIDIVSRAFGNLAIFIRDQVIPAVQAIIARFQQFVTEITPLVQGALAAIQAFWTDHGAQIMAIVTNAWENIKSILNIAMELIGGIIKIALSVIQGDWSGAWEAMKTMLSNIWENIKSILQNSADSLKQILSLAWEAIKTTASAAWTALKDNVLAPAWENIKTLVSEKVEDLKTLVASLPGKAADSLKDIGTVLVDKGKALIQGLINGASSMASALAAKVWQIVQDALASIWGAITGAVGGAPSGGGGGGGGSPRTGPRMFSTQSLGGLSSIAEASSEVNAQGLRNDDRRDQLLMRVEEHMAIQDRLLEIIANNSGNLGGGGGGGGGMLAFTGANVRTNMRTAVLR